MNALQHGCDAAPENEAAVMRALGEDPERYAALQRELSTTYGPGDALWDQQLADLARLYWRRNRIERMETGLMRRALQAVEEPQRGRARALADVTFEPSQTALMDLDLPLPNDRCVRLRQLLSLLGVISEQVKRQVFVPRQAPVLRTYYKGQVGWRPVRIDKLLQPYMAWLQHEEDRRDKTYKKYMDNPEELPLPGPEHHQELLRLLEEEIAAVEAAFAGGDRRRRRRRTRSSATPAWLRRGRLGRC